MQGSVYNTHPDFEGHFRTKKRSRLVLAAKGVKYDCCNVNCMDKPDWFSNLTPNGTVPVLEFQDGQVLSESVIVCEYLDEAFPQQPLYPQDILEKNKQRVLIKHFDGKFTSAQFKIRDDPSVKGDFKKELQFYEKELTTRKSTYFGGKRPGMVDYMIWPFFERIEAYENMLEVFQGTELPTLKKWYDAMKTDPTVKTCAFPTEWYIESRKLTKQGNPDYQLVGVK